ncbi:MAG: hypothetical protein ABR909_02640 [Candidatus Bathyarchaeia archaeon]|jgi:uncharacterized protein YaaQ
MSTGESPEHKQIQNGLMDYLKKEGFEIYKAAARDGYPECDNIGGRVPDIMGKNSQGLIAIGEAKTCDDLDNERTNDQFKIFSNLSVASGNMKDQTCPFYIGIPKSCINELKQNLAKLGLNNKTNIHIIYFEI